MYFDQENAIPFAGRPTSEWEPPFHLIGCDARTLSLRYSRARIAALEPFIDRRESTITLVR